jgi:hypothetical protein
MTTTATDKSYIYIFSFGLAGATYVFFALIKKARAHAVIGDLFTFVLFIKHHRSDFPILGFDKNCCWLSLISPHHRKRVRVRVREGERWRDGERGAAFVARRGGRRGDFLDKE